MNEMSNPINFYIAEQLQQEGSSESLKKLIHQHTSTLCVLLQLPSDKANECLLRFTCRYIEIIPEYLQAFSSLAQHSGIIAYTEAFFNEVHAFYTDKHPVADSALNTQALLCRSYMAHRMLEELNDRIAIERRLPLVPIEMGHTNLIIHTLIGDERANLLDQTVLIRLELVNMKMAKQCKGIFEKPEVKSYVNQHKIEGWGQRLEQWPCLSEDLTRLLD